MLRLPALALLLVAAAALAACAAPTPVPLDVAHVTDGPRDPDGPKVLVVVAHPDDDIAFAGVMYKNATHLGGATDVCVLTNGEGGFKYATLAEPVHGLELTDEEVGRRELPAIRRAEMVEGARIMNVRRVMFFRQQDHRYTTDEGEILGEGAGVWAVDAVRETLAEVMRRGDYDFLLTFFPSEGTHGHHKSAAILALQAAGDLSPDERPVALGVRFVRGDDPPAAPEGLEGWAITDPLPGAPTFDFDRTQGFGHEGRLDYRIIVNWAIAAHRSQGTMQLFMGNTSERENYVVYQLLAEGAAPDDVDRALMRTGDWFERLAEPQYPGKTYGPSAGAPRERPPGG